MVVVDRGTLLTQIEPCVVLVPAVTRRCCMPLFSTITCTRLKLPAFSMMPNALNNANAANAGVIPIRYVFDSCNSDQIHVVLTPVVIVPALRILPPMKAPVLTYVSLNVREASAPALRKASLI